jgi:hypothetical protein
MIDDETLLSYDSHEKRRVVSVQCAANRKNYITWTEQQ